MSSLSVAVELDLLGPCHEEQFLVVTVDSKEFFELRRCIAGIRTAGHLQRDAEPESFCIVGGSFARFCATRVMKNKFLVTVVMPGVSREKNLQRTFVSVVGWFTAFCSRPEISQVQFLDTGGQWTHVHVSLLRLLGVFLAERGWTRTLPVVVQRQVPVVPRYAALVVNDGGMAGFAGSDAPRAVLAFPLCSLDCRQAQGFRLWWRFHRCSSWTRLWCFFTGAVVQTVHSVWRCRSCSSSRTLTSPSWRSGFSHSPDSSADL